MTNYEQFLASLEAFVTDSDTGQANRNEATTRLHLIDRLFFDCLQWQRPDVILEDSHAGAYADYVFTRDRRTLIVEAKREGTYFTIPIGTQRLDISIPALVRGNEALADALRQVTGYCQRRGVPLGVVSNGHQLVCVMANRSDGVPPLEGRALVFESPAVMRSSSLDLWNALSPQAVQDRAPHRRLLGNVHAALPQKLSAALHGYPGIKNRNVFQAELQTVSELVLEDVASHRGIEAVFLRECYCKSGALSQYSLISKELLQARYSALFGPTDPGPAITPIASRDGVATDLLADPVSSRPILIIGDVGVGKTSFIRNLIKVEASAIFDNAIGLYIDLGTQAILTQDVRAFILNDITRQLREDHGIDVQENGFVRDVYRAELLRFRAGIYSSIIVTDPDLFRVKELEFLEAMLGDKEHHLRSSVQRIATSRHKQVVVFLDNADQRDDTVQQTVFLIAQELAARWHATVFMTLRPETFHRSLKVGAISGYHPKAFTVLPPRIDRVITARLEFALRIARGEIPVESLRGVRVHLAKLEALLKCFLISLRTNQELIECLDNVAAGNVRLALDLVRDFFGSGHIDTRKIVELVENDRSYVVPLHEFLRAVIYGDGVYYDPSRSSVANLFDLSTSDPAEHFILPTLISVLHQWTGPGAEDGFVEAPRVYERMQGFGYSVEQIDVAVVRAHSRKLVESAGRRLPADDEMPSAMRATTAGVYHVQRLSKMFTYLDAIAVDLPVLEASIRDNIHDAHSIQERLARAVVLRGYVDKVWDTVKDRRLPFNWPATSHELAEEMRGIRDRVEARAAQTNLLPS